MYLKDCCLNLKVKKDEGYAWLILIFGFIGFIIQSSCISSVGIFLLPMTVTLDESVYKISWIPGLVQLSYGIAGIFSGTIIRKFSAKKVIFISAIISSSSYMISAMFINNIYALYITMGVLPGFALNFTNISIISSIPLWFDKKKSMSFSFLSVGFSVGIFIWIPIIGICETSFGWRGALLIQSGLCLHTFAISLIFIKPPASNINISIIKDEVLDESSKNTKDIKSNSNVFISLMTNPSLIILIIVRFFVYVPHLLPTAFLPAKIIMLDLPKNYGPLLLSILAITSIIVRLVIGFISDSHWYDRFLAYSLTIFLAGCLHVYSSFANSFVLMTIYMVLLAICTAHYMIFGFVLISDTIKDKRQMSQAMGLDSFVNGISKALSLIIAGAIYDTTKDINMPFRTLGLFAIFGGILSFIPTFLNYKNKKSLRGSLEETISIHA